MQRTIKYDVLSSEVNDAKELRLKLGDSQDEQGGVYASCAQWGTDGFISRPADPADSGPGKGACQAIVAQDGNDVRCIATKDNRLNERYGELAPGDRAIVTIGTARVIVKNEGESINLAVENGDGSGLMLQQMSGQSGTWQLLVPGSFGSAMVSVKSGEIVLCAGSGCGYLRLDQFGVHVHGPWFGANTGGGNLGTVAGLVPPTGVNSILKGPTGIAGTPAPNWTVSPA
jgi:hypothetical protein